MSSIFGDLSTSDILFPVEVQFLQFEYCFKVSLKLSVLSTDQSSARILLRAFASGL